MRWHKTKVHTAVLECNPSGIYGKKSYQRGNTRAYRSPVDKIRAEEIAEFYRDFVGTNYRDWSDEVHVKIDVQRPLAKSSRRSENGRPDTQKPDCDNISKLVLDALKGIAWVDDAQVTSLRVIKHPRFIRKEPYLRVEVTYILNERKDND